MGIMTIDGQAIEFTDEPSLHCAIIQNYLYMEPVVFVQWKMTGERPLPPVQKNQKTEWSSIRIHQG